MKVIGQWSIRHEFRIVQHARIMFINNFIFISYIYIYIYIYLLQLVHKYSLNTHTTTIGTITTYFIWFALVASIHNYTLVEFNQHPWPCNMFGRLIGVHFPKTHCFHKAGRRTPNYGNQQVCRCYGNAQPFWNASSMQKTPQMHINKLPICFEGLITKHIRHDTYDLFVLGTLFNTVIPPQRVCQRVAPNYIQHHANN